jgi:hypothetical protein
LRTRRSASTLCGQLRERSPTWARPTPCGPTWCVRASSTRPTTPSRSPPRGSLASPLSRCWLVVSH